MKTFFKLYKILPAVQRRKGLSLFLLVSGSALSDALGVASIMPFIAILTDPGIIERNTYLNHIFVIFGEPEYKYFLSLIGFCVFVTFLTGLVLKIFTILAQMRFIYYTEFLLSHGLFKSYISKPFFWFLDSHSADMSKSVLSEVNDVVSSGLYPAITFVAQTLTVIAILIVLLVINPIVSLAAGIGFGLIYLVIYLFLSGLLVKLGKERVEANKKRFKVLNETFNTIKEIKLGNFENTFLRRFADAAETYATREVSAQSFSNTPRYVVEAIAFGALLAVIILLILNDNEFSSMLPLITLYALAAYRLLPALQQVYSSLSQLRYATPAIDALQADLIVINHNVEKHRLADLNFDSLIQFADVSFSYQSSPSLSLKNVNLIIPTGSNVGIVGASGGGKTTFLDILLGLLLPQDGVVKIGREKLNYQTLASWQKLLGYVPQQINLIDDTVSSNIAFGIENENIDQSAVEKAAKAASIHEFIVNELSDGYQTRIGEKGVRLSGGQRQRLAIARALYKEPKILILDEATSALDTISESDVMAAIRKMSKNITIVQVAHRLNILKECDFICVFDKGRLTEQGTYDELISKSDRFRALVEK